MSDIKKILFLPGWYPNRTHLSVGSFVRSHAEAIDTKLKVDVLYVCGDECLKKIYRFEKTEVNNVGTYILYYRKSKSKHPFFQLLKGFLYVFGQFYGYYKYRKINSRPLFFHVHVLSKAAILPYVLKLIRKKTNYYITEHWSRYLPQDNSYNGWLRKAITKSIVNKSNGVTTVSENLKFHMNRHGLNHSNFQVISNVTEAIFFETENKNTIKPNHFVHVSNFAANCKNVEGILNAFKILQDKGYSFSLTMVGDGDDFELAKQKINEHNLKNVDFTGFIYGKDVVDVMCEAKALVMFSNYENQPVVITESLSLGVPVIATTVGGIPEMIDDTNGILVKPKDVEALADAIARVITEEVFFDRDRIKEEAAQKFKSDVIAEEFIKFYRDGGADL